ncbi:VOC family protein [Cytobacillus purgationiresistens]|uniref:Catechol 2,3-dioxygenase n=1 Tax=Cytobacillus purgationiresistens TaxID=863449 RepID=A0ABU0AGZ7_9BACI|nr:VOC family protein [Cytobacillus purgationiresistens]MDQ0270534.1 catechol 2,3-dioxygenase [Cytobacillus purgationiresistens]
MSFHAKPNIFVNQVELKVEDLQRSLDFYQNTIGFKVLEKTDRTASLTADGAHPLLTIEQPEDIKAKEPRRTGLYHYALLLPTRAHLAKIIRHFIKTGYPLQGASDHDVSEALYLADPDGNGIEIYTDRPSSKWEWKGKEVVMGTNALDVQSIMDEWDGRPWEGLPAETVMGHIHLHVNNIEEAKHFYRNGLGFDIVNNYGNQALFISTGKYHHHIGLNIWNGIGAPPPSENSAGMQSFTLVFPYQTVLDRIISQLESVGASIAKEDGVQTVQDPSGNKIRLIVE